MAEAATTMARSTLEELLESIKSQDDKPKDLPPALPKRPTSRARLPSSVRLRKAIGSPADGGILAPSTNGRTYVTFDQVEEEPALDHLSVEIDGDAHQGLEDVQGSGYAVWDAWDDGNSTAHSDLLTTPTSPVSEDPPASPTPRFDTVESFAKSWPVSSPAQSPQASSSEISGASDAAFSLQASDLDPPSLSVSAEAATVSISTVFNADPLAVSSPTFITARVATDRQQEQGVEEPEGTSADVFDVLKRPLSRGASGFSFLTTPDSAGFALPSSPRSIVTSRTLSRKWKEEGVHGLKKNSRVWCLGLSNEWFLGAIQSTSDGETSVRTPGGRVIKTATLNLQPANPDILEGVDDLTQLSYLNEPSVLHDLQYRYERDMIYTRAGPVLIAVNPFKKVPLYTPDFIQAYRKKSTDSLGPHVYLVADSAYNAMVSDEINQSIIISGESGAGKTETAKIAMQYLAALGGGNGVENEILQTNPILEAFGNAKTLRNDNSSRFGKLIDIHFARSGKICGAKIQTYLLEKSRVVHQAEGERNYHIFYQLCTGADAGLQERLRLRRAEHYHYLNQSGCMQIENVNDRNEFQTVKSALTIVQITPDDQELAFAMLSAVLWIGNISFSEFDSDGHATVNTDEALEAAAFLLQCGTQDLIEALCTRKIRAGCDDIVQRLNLVQAMDSRDALAKAIYAGLFDWLVEKVNKSLEFGKRRTGRSISILDIYGFECFKRNSFEQLCINFANERLQQHFNRHLFKLEQEEYNAEGIDWTKVEFEDNQECLELIEKRPLGLISLLDEECTFPQATDYTLAQKLNEHLKTNACFKGERNKAFRICHYAGEVVYDTTGFLEKNRDLLHADLLNLLSSCDSSLPQLFSAEIAQSVQKLISPTRRGLGGAESQKQSVSTKFKGQLSKLMQRLESTAPHFIRCIKPNKLQHPGVYEQDLVLQQLRCCGVLEVVRISRSGYPTRHLHHKFAERYGFLLPKAVAEQQDILSVCVAILQQFGIHQELYQVGLTKLFFRAGQIGKLEDLRLRTLQGVLAVQKVFRGYRERRAYKRLQKAVVHAQTWARGAKARRLYKIRLEEHRAAVTIQKHAKRRAAERAFHSLRVAVIAAQKVSRVWLARRALQARRKEVEEKCNAERISEDVEIERTSAPQVGDDDESKKAEDLEVVRTAVRAEESERADALLEAQASELLEWKRRALAAEEALREQEEDNAMLRQRLHQYEDRWLEYEAKMSSMEVVWQQQMTSLQVSLAAAKKTLANDDSEVQQTKHEEGTNLRTTAPKLQRATRHILPHEDDDFDWDDATSRGTRTPEPGTTPVRYTDGSVNDITPAKELDVGRPVISRLVKEFDHRTQVFDDDAEFLVEVKSGLAEATLNPEQELRRLKQRFDEWRRDFKVRLRETKTVLQRLGTQDSGDKNKKKWWGKRSST